MGACCSSEAKREKWLEVPADLRDASRPFQRLCEFTELEAAAHVYHLYVRVSSGTQCAKAKAKADEQKRKADRAMELRKRKEWLTGKGLGVSATALSGDEPTASGSSDRNSDPRSSRRASGQSRGAATGIARAGTPTQAREASAGNSHQHIQHLQASFQEGCQLFVKPAYERGIGPSGSGGCQSQRGTNRLVPNFLVRKHPYAQFRDFLQETLGCHRTDFERDLWDLMLGGHTVCGRLGFDARGNPLDDRYTGSCLTYQSFMHWIWLLCVATPHILATVAFRLRDDDRRLGYLETDEAVENLVRYIAGDPFVDEHLIQVRKHSRVSFRVHPFLNRGKPCVSQQSFTALVVEALPAVGQRLADLQAHVRSLCGSTDVWTADRISKGRGKLKSNTFLKALVNCLRQECDCLERCGINEPFLVQQPLLRPADLACADAGIEGSPSMAQVNYTSGRSREHSHRAGTKWGVSQDKPGDSVGALTNPALTRPDMLWRHSGSGSRGTSAAVQTSLLDPHGTPSAVSTRGDARACSPGSRTPASNDHEEPDRRLQRANAKSLRDTRKSRPRTRHHHADSDSPDDDGGKGNDAQRKAQLRPAWASTRLPRCGAAVAVQYLLSVPGHPLIPTIDAVGNVLPLDKRLRWGRATSTQGRPSDPKKTEQRCASVGSVGSQDYDGLELSGDVDVHEASRSGGSLAAPGPSSRSSMRAGGSSPSSFPRRSISAAVTRKESGRASRGSSCAGESLFKGWGKRLSAFRPVDGTAAGDGQHSNSLGGVGRAGATSVPGSSGVQSGMMQPYRSHSAFGRRTRMHSDFGHHSSASVDVDENPAVSGSLAEEKAEGIGGFSRVGAEPGMDREATGTPAKPTAASVGNSGGLRAANGRSRTFAAPILNQPGSLRAPGRLPAIPDLKPIRNSISGLPGRRRRRKTAPAVRLGDAAPSQSSQPQQTAGDPLLEADPFSE